MVTRRTIFLGGLLGGAMAATYLKVPNGILVPILTDIINNGWGNAGPGNMQVGLYASNYTPAPTDTALTYTAIEASFNGYARNVLATSLWGAPSLIGNGAYALGPPCLWTAGLVAFTAQTVYGYFVLNPAGALAWAQLLPSPVVIALPGDSLSLTPQYSYLSQH